MKLLYENDTLLRTPSSVWDFETDGDPMPLVEEMIKIMFTNNGIGLAAPQIGVNKRLFIMGNKDLLVTCINPEIISSEGKIRDIEGCLSFPDLWLNVYRAEKINVRYQQVDNTTKETQLSGIFGRVFQHELDHLDGVCFDTKVGNLSLKSAKKRRSKIK